MRVLMMLILAALLASCEQGADSPRGFSLPAGDVAKGEEVFLTYQCLACHSLKGFEEQELELDIAKRVRLGGDVTRIKTYAELVTAVINPSHKIATSLPAEQLTNSSGQSLMRNYNEVMTVAELTDLVAFLQPQYQLKPFNRTNYPTYFP